VVVMIVMVMVFGGEGGRSDRYREQECSENFLHGRIVPCSAFAGINQSNASPAWRREASNPAMRIR
jgi:hypothetical protein